MTEIEHYTPPESVDSWANMLPAVGDLAGKIAGTEFVPAALQNKPAAVAAAVLAGREIGLGPMSSLQHLHVIEGRPALSAQMQRALVLAAGHDIRFVEMTSTRCIAEGRRRGQSEPTRVTWTMDDAKRAGLDGRANWRRHPRRMLQARASSELCQLLFADVVAGFGTVEELEDDAEGPAPEGSTPAQRTARRARPASGAGARSAASNGEPPPADGPSEPPLPGDEPTGITEPTPDVAADEEMITREQSTKLHTVFGQIGVGDRTERISSASTIVGRPLDTSAELTKTEASTLIDTLEYVAASDDPPENLRQLLGNVEQFTDEGSAP